MSNQLDPDLVFVNTASVEFGSNVFTNVPVILQYDEEPLIEAIQATPAGFTSQFRIFNASGDYLAKVVGARVFKVTPSVDIKLIKNPGITVCEMDGKTLFELRHSDPSALKTEAELYTPDGRFVRSRAGVPLSLLNGTMQIGGLQMSGCRFAGCRIGVWLKSDGSSSIGVY